MLNQRKNKKRSLKGLSFKEIAKLSQMSEEEWIKDTEKLNKDLREHPEAVMEYFKTIGKM